MAGFVYILSNPSFDGRIKIGKSSKDPSQGRVDELSSETSAPEPFKLEYYCFVDQYHKLEKLVHSELKYIRPNPKREFFTIDKEAAVKVIQNLAPQCGGIKFEECFFQIQAGEEPEQQLIPDENSGDIPENSVNILDNYPKAKLVLEYNELASAMLYKLKNCPESATEEFYSSLENKPDVTNTELKELFDRNFKSKYLEPFENFPQNFRYAFCLSKSPEMAAEYFNVSKTLNKSVDNYTAFVRICEKFDIPQNNIPDVSDEFSSYIKSELSSMIVLTSDQLEIVEDYLSIYGLHLAKNSKIHNIYTLFRGATKITPQFTDNKLAEFFIYVFDPHRIKDTYITENGVVKSDQSSVEKNNEPKSSLSKTEKIDQKFPKKDLPNIEKSDPKIDGKKLKVDFNQVPSKFLKILSILFVAFIILNIIYLSS